MAEQVPIPGSEKCAINGWIALVLLLVVSPAFYAYLQSGLNPSWETLRAEAPGPVPAA